MFVLKKIKDNLNYFCKMLFDYNWKNIVALNKSAFLNLKSKVSNL